MSNFNTNQHKSQNQQAIDEFTQVDGSRIVKEYPAIDGLLSAMDYAPVKPYNRTDNPVPDGSYLQHMTDSPYRANAMRDNVLNTTMSELQRAGYKKEHTTAETVEMIAAGAAAIEEREYAYRMAGLLKPLYNDSDIVEHRYALAARLLAQHQQQKANERQQGDHEFESFENMAGLEYEQSDQEDDAKQDIKEFVEKILNLEPFMPIVSKYIDQCFGAPTERVRHTRMQDDDGDQIDLIDLDPDNLQNIAPESLAELAVGDPAILAIQLAEHELAAIERYTEQTRKYIDVFIIDNSGSMGGDRIMKAAAYLYNRLEKVVRGWAMLSIVQFSSSAYTVMLPEDVAGDEPRWLINTPEKAEWMMTYILKSYANFSGGGTNIPAGVQLGIKLAHEMEKFGGILPNITVVTDDDPSIRNMNPDAIGMPVNGIGVSWNESMNNFCIRTAGKYYDLDAITFNAAVIQSNLRG